MATAMEKTDSTVSQRTEGSKISQASHESPSGVPISTTPISGQSSRSSPAFVPQIILNPKRPSKVSIPPMKRGRRGSVNYDAATIESKHFNAKELQNLAKQFNTWTNKKNLMDREGFRKSLGLLGMVQDALLCHQLFRVFNKSGSGQIDFEEYVTGLGVLMKGSLDEKLDFSFNMTDIDGSGEISFEELLLTVDSMMRIYAGIMGGHTTQFDKEKIRKVFAHLDKNHDGKISLEEYKVGMKKHPEFLNTLRGTELFRPLGASNAAKAAQSKIEKLEHSLSHVLEQLYVAEDAITALKTKSISQPSISVKSNGNHEAPKGGPEDNGDADEEDPMMELMKAVTKARLIAESVVPLSDRPVRDSQPPSLPTTPSGSSSVDENRTRFDEEEKTSMEKVPTVDESVVEHLKELNEWGPDDGLPPLPPSNSANNTRKGLIVYFGHKNWDLVVNVMKGIQMAVSRSAMEQDRPVSQYDFTVKEKYTLVSGPSQSAEQRTRFVDYAPFVFAKLREYFHIDHDEYMSSIGPGSMLSNLMLGSLSSLAEMGSEGKSGSFFYLSSDNRFLVKTVRKDEHKLLRHILPSYFRHMTKVGQTEHDIVPDSMLTRIVGCHVVRSSKRSKTRTGANKVYFVVMTNALETTLDIHRKYDLKGSWVGRRTPAAARDDPSKTLKDVDFTESEDRIFVDGKMKERLMASLRRDANFLESHHIIDYSVLLGIHDHSHQSASVGTNVSDASLMMLTKSPSDMSLNVVNKGLNQGAGSSSVAIVDEHTPFFTLDHGGFRSLDMKQTYFMGIIDFLTQYGERKRIERIVKSIAHLSGSGLSVMPARAYAKRFLTFLDKKVIVSDCDRVTYFSSDKMTVSSDLRHPRSSV